MLSGAGARGAFQAGALAEILPALARDGLKPSIWLGTSAGSVNAALWAAVADLPADEAARAVEGTWRRMGEDDVYRPIPLSLARAGAAFLGGVLGLGDGPSSFFDTAPLRHTAEEVLDAGRITANIAAGHLDHLGVVATRMPTDADAEVGGTASGRSVLFLQEGAVSEYAGDRGHALDVVREPIRAAHVLASSAIPMAFAPVRVTGPADGWYLDGGVRLNTPLHPAVGLGADRIVLVAATSTTYAEPAGAPPHAAPDLADVTAQVLHAVLADRTAEDLRALRRTNRLVAQARVA